MNFLKRFNANKFSFENLSFEYINQNIINNINTYVFIIFLLMYFLFSHIDISIIGYHSYFLTDGNILNFYDYTEEHASGSPSYPITTFIVMGIWNLIPKYFFGLDNPGGPITGYYLIFYKSIVLIFFFINLFFLKLIFEIFFPKKNIKEYIFFFSSSSWILFSVFIFSQVDIFSILFLVIGIYFIITKNIFLASFIIGISFTFKLFSLLAFIPLILILEKNPIRIILLILISSIPYFITFYIYSDSEAFMREVIGFSALGKIYSAKITGTNISIFPFIYTLICLYCLKLKTNNLKSSLKNYFSVCVLIFSFLFILFPDPHPQWLIYFGVFSTLAIIFNERFNYKNYILLEILCFYFFISYCVQFYQQNVDQQLLQWGQLKYILDHSSFYGFSLTDRVMNDFFINNYIISKDLNFTIFASLLFILTLMIMFPKYFNKINIFNIPKISLLNAIYFKYFLTFIIFAFPAILCIDSILWKIIVISPAFYSIILLAKRSNLI